MPDIPFQTQIKNNNIELIPNKIHVSNKNYHRIYVYLRAGWHISKAKFVQEKPLQGSEEKIIQQIHTIRFNKTNPYVITGGHFYQLFVRNLGIFFNALLDRRISCTDEDWLNRQTIALRTVALDLEVFRQTQKDYTTIIPIRENLFSCFNFYARPSDSLFAILYTLLALTDEKFIETIFPMSQTKKRSLQTKNAGHLLYKNYKTSLKKLIQIYFEDVIDGQTGLVKKNLLLASARDGIKRESSFYDNVIAWATIRLANKLDLYQISDSKLESWKKHIIQTFWDEKEGSFIDDLSKIRRKQNFFVPIVLSFFRQNFLNQITRSIKNIYCKWRNTSKKINLMFLSPCITANLIFLKSYIVLLDILHHPIWEQVFGVIGVWNISKRLFI